MRVHFLSTICLAIAVTQSFGAPARANTKPTDDHNAVDYQRYLDEVKEALDSDRSFNEALDKINVTDTDYATLAEQLNFASHRVRTQLDEIKRREVRRLGELVRRQDGSATDGRHLDHSNKETFEIKDLHKLIVKAGEDVREIDRKRREEFKRYEMQKEAARRERLRQVDGEERKKLIKEHEEMEVKHKAHEKLHSPGHKAQLEEVWKEEDKLTDQQFNPRIFFILHDIDSNGYWDEFEVKALFRHELNKMYEEGAPEDDIYERMEEMERMREAAMRETDADEDGLVSYREFLAHVEKDTFAEDEGWKGVDEAKIYTEEEMKIFLEQVAKQQKQAQT